MRAPRVIGPLSAGRVGRRSQVGPRMKRFIVVSGLPASGKSTLAAAVAAQLKLPLLDKDAILESLFETLGAGDSSWRTRLSRSADGIMQQLATQSQGAVLASWWRHRLSTAMSGTSPDWLLSLGGELVELHCKCDPHTAARRFFSRRRHPGHLDNLKSETEELARFKQSHDHGALGIGRVVEVDTERPPDIHRILLQLSAPGG